MAPEAAISIFAPPLGVAVAEAAVPDAEELPLAAPPVAVDSFAFSAASAEGSSDADTPVPLLQVLGTLSDAVVNVMSAHCLGVSI